MTLLRVVIIQCRCLRVKRGNRKYRKRHADIKWFFESFINNILNGLPNSEQAAPGNEGIHAVEWANAMLISSLKQKAVQLPVDRREYDEMLAQLRSREIIIDKKNYKIREYKR